MQTWLLSPAAGAMQLVVAGKPVASEPGTFTQTILGTWGPLPTISRCHGMHCDLPEIDLLPFETYVWMLVQALGTPKDHGGL